MKKGTIAKRIVVLVLVLACLVNTSGMHALATGITSQEESTEVTSEAFEENTSEAITEEAITEETTVEETTLENETEEETTEVEKETEETSLEESVEESLEEIETEEETTEESYAPVFRAPLAAAPRAQINERVTMSSEGNQTYPENATWFFDSHNESSSFKKGNDTYWDVLDKNPNDLVLVSNTDGSIRNISNGNGNGIFVIDWENGYRDQSETPIGGSALMSGNGSTDGTYTVVGWGGNFEDGAKKVLRLWVKDSGDGTLTDSMSHLTIYLVNDVGTIIDKCWVNSTDGLGTGTNNLHLVRLTDDEDDPYKGTDGYYCFEADLHGDSNARGIKLAFDRCSAAETSSTSYASHTGTLFIKDVKIRIGDDVNNWKDFGPFDYYDDASKYDMYFTDPVLGKKYLPFLRSAHYAASINAGETSGHNRLKNGWMMWTMSTSDANIVKNAYSGDNVTALQVKYRNDEKRGGTLDREPHTSYTHLNGTVNKNGEWLVMTLGGTLDLKMQLELMRDGNHVAYLTLGSFKTTKDVNGSGVPEDYFKDNKYHTVYYPMPTDADYSFDSIHFMFDGAPDGVAVDKTRDSRFMYLTEVYLLGTSAEISKTVDKTESSPNEILTYNITVTNNGSETINSFIVEDKLPNWVTFVSANPAVNHSEGKITWNGTNSLAPNQSATATITVQVKADTPNKTELINQAVITKLNDKDKTINSNPVKTIILSKTPENYVFYAEVGQKTYLPITLGQTGVSGSATGDMETQSNTFNLPGNDAQHVSDTWENVTIPEGAIVTLELPTSAFILANNAVSIGGTVWDLDENNLNQNTFELSGGAIYSGLGETDDTGASVNGNIQGLNTGSVITLKNVPAIKNGKITINMYKVWNVASVGEVTMTIKYPKSIVNETDPVDTNETLELTFNGADYSDNSYQTSSKTINMDSAGSIKITTDKNGGISIRSIKVDGKTVLWMANEKVKAPSLDFVATGYIGEGVGKGEISNLQNGYITIPGLNAGSHTIEFRYRSWYSENSGWCKLKFATTVTSVLAGSEEPADDTFAEIPTKTDLANIVPVENPSQLTRADLKYTSDRTGRDEFIVKYHPGGDTTQTKEIKVTVFNYQAANKVYVLDYGLPVDLTANDANNTNPLTVGGVLKLENDDTTYAIRGIDYAKRNTNGVADESDYAKSYGVQNGALNLAQAKVEIDYETRSVIYTPTHFMDSAMTFVYGVQVIKDNEQGPYTSLTGTPVMEGSVKVVPANVVYYEDNFSHSNTSDADGSNGIVFTDGVHIEGSSQDSMQSNSKDTQYGYDNAYTDDSQNSNGSVSLMPKSVSAAFKFKGTGFEIISRTNTNTGNIMVMVFDAANNERIQKDVDNVIRVYKQDGTIAQPMSIQSVNTYYENGDLYQVPIINRDLKAYGTYIVVMISTSINDREIYLDGIQIHNPAGNTDIINDYLESERNAKTFEVRQMILGTDFKFNYEKPAESTGGDNKMATLVQWHSENNSKLFLNGVTVTENFTGAYFEGTPSDQTANTTNLLTYAVQGPNNELYLENGYAVAFKAKVEEMSTNTTLQIAVKNVSGNPILKYLAQNGSWKALPDLNSAVTSATEMYYRIDVEDCYEMNGTKLIVLSAQGNDGDILSFTNVKVNGYQLSPVETDSDMDVFDNLTENEGLFKYTDITMLAPLQNNNLIITFAAAKQVVGVMVTDNNGNEIPVETSSYVFANDNDNTWTVRFPAEKGMTYTLRIYSKEHYQEKQIGY